MRPFETATWAELPLAVQIESPRGAVVLLRLTIRRRKLPHYAADLTAEPPSFPRVVGLDANYYYWGYCNPRTGRAMAWYGVNRKGAYLRLCQTSPKIRLRLPRNGVREVWQDGYRLVLLPRLAFFALWDGMGEAFVVPRATARVLEAALPGGSYASGHVPTAESATVSDALGGERADHLLPTMYLKAVPSMASRRLHCLNLRATHSTRALPGLPRLTRMVRSVCNLMNLSRVRNPPQRPLAHLLPPLKLLTLAIVTLVNQRRVAAPDLAAILASPDTTQVVSGDVNAPLVTIAIDEAALAPAVLLLRVPHLERLCLKR